MGIFYSYNNFPLSKTRFNHNETTISSYPDIRTAHLYLSRYSHPHSYKFDSERNASFSEGFYLDYIKAEMVSFQQSIDNFP